jgi:chromosome segregation ATPase
MEKTTESALSSFADCQDQKWQTNKSETEELPDKLKAKIAEATACLAILANQKSEIQTMITDLEQQLTDVRAIMPELSHFVSKAEFDARESAYKDADTAYKSAFKKLNDELKTIRKGINAKKAEIGKKLTIRGKPLPCSDDEWCCQYQVIRDLEATITEAKNRHLIPPPPSQKDREFFEKYRFYSYYENDAQHFDNNKILPIKKQLKRLRAKLAELNKAIKEEIWRPKYLAYA